MLEQYGGLKREAGDAILLYRLGDFYEMFFEDAEAAAPLLGLVLTARHRDSDIEAPMCGIPWHQLDAYVARLVAAGKKVAIADQTEAPQKGKTARRAENRPDRHAWNGARPGPPRRAPRQRDGRGRARDGRRRARVPRPLDRGLLGHAARGGGRGGRGAPPAGPGRSRLLRRATARPWRPGSRRSAETRPRSPRSRRRRGARPRRSSSGVTSGRRRSSPSAFPTRARPSRRRRRSSTTRGRRSSRTARTSRRSAPSLRRRGSSSTR